VASSLHKLGIDGALGGQQQDGYFYLVESNVSVNKSSQFIRQDINYEVTLGPDGWPSLTTLTVDEKNTFRPEDKIPGFPENSFDGLIWPRAFLSNLGRIGQQVTGVDTNLIRCRQRLYVHRFPGKFVPDQPRIISPS